MEGTVPIPVLLENLVGKLEKIRKSLKQVSTSPDDIKDIQEYQIGIMVLLKALGEFWVNLQGAIRLRNEPNGSNLVVRYMKEYADISHRYTKAPSKLNKRQCYHRENGQILRDVDAEAE